MHLGTTAQEWRSFSDKERYEHIKALQNHFAHYISYWCDQNLFEEAPAIDESLYSDVVKHYYNDLERMAENIDSEKGSPATPDDFKQKAIYAFWIRKIKPIKIDRPIKGLTSVTGNWINEIIAIFIVLTELDIIFKKKVASELLETDLYRDLLYFFRYKSVSPHALYLILASLYL